MMQLLMIDLIQVKCFVCWLYIEFFVGCGDIIEQEYDEVKVDFQNCFEIVFVEMYVVEMGVVLVILEEQFVEEQVGVLDVIGVFGEVI